MTTALGRRAGHPTGPAVALLAAAAALLAATPLLPLAVPLLAWTLLGVTAGYSISGSV
ncbi:hypothetical protein [Dactylosporangium sp. NPDC051541]|uniref:hypothetical protein n=1 Tax=Dactylosporangium sp. NPDC051541 TaxID=3363977 RepID=UPI0037B9F141